MVLLSVISLIGRVCSMMPSTINETDALKGSGLMERNAIAELCSFRDSKPDRASTDWDGHINERKDKRL